MPVFHHQDQVGVADRRESMGNDETGPIGTERRHGVCTSSSVRVSTELVASSRIRTAGSARKARVMVVSCFSPSH
jgi:hypothetical protein